MRDKETVRLEVDHVPTHQETVDKCFEAFEKLPSLIANAKGSYEDGLYIAAKHFLDRSQETIEEIRVLVGGT